MSKGKEAICSATLIVLGSDLDPDLISRSLELTPDKVWRKGERKSFTKADGITHYFDSYHQWGGWKRFTSQEELTKPLEEQVEAWSDVLIKRKHNLIELQELGYRVIIDCCIVSSESEVVHLRSELQRVFGDLNIDIHIAFYAHEEVTQNEV
jgi:hypothetical protein